MIDAQRRFFTALRDRAGVPVHFVDHGDTRTTANRIAALTSAANHNSASAFQAIVNWLAAEPPMVLT